MNVLVVNCGSSSVKYSLIDAVAGESLHSGVIEQIGESEVANHTQALEIVSDAVEEFLQANGLALFAVGHRVVHGGDRYCEPTEITEEVIRKIEELSVLAPLHNPANLLGIRAAQAAFGNLPQVAVFDTAFHSTIPVENRTYAVPRSWETDYGVRKYGFHGTSHNYVSRKAIEWLEQNKEITASESKVVVLHLGNGASASAVLGGSCINTSMGLTPLPGLHMGTRSGDVDPAVFGHMKRVAGMGVDEVEDALNFKSGLLGMCGESDMRSVEIAASQGDGDAQLALAVYTNKIQMTIGGYATLMNGVDALVFTAGVGENSLGTRKRVIDRLGYLGLHLDVERNAAAGFDPVHEISAAESKVAALVIATDEEGEIARQAVQLLSSKTS